MHLYLNRDKFLKIAKQKFKYEIFSQFILNYWRIGSSESIYICMWKERVVKVLRFQLN